MKIALLTNIFTGGTESWTGVKGDFIGGAEVYLSALIKNVLEPMANEIVVFQKVGVPKRLSLKTSVINASFLNGLELSSFDLVIINGLQTIATETKSLKTKSIAIHHGMVLPHPLNLNVLRTYLNYADAFNMSSANSKLYRPIRLLLGERFAGTSLMPLRVLSYAMGYERERHLGIATVNHNSAKVDCVVSVDKDSLRYVKPVTRKNWRIIYNFVDLELTNAGMQIQRKFKGTTILVPRNLVTARGVFAIPKLALLLRADGFDNFRFLVPGTGYLKSFLLNEIRRLRLEKEVILLGHQDHFKDMPRLFSESDIILVPTFDSEGTSLAVLEGMAFKKPVVTTDVGGLNDIGVNGKHKLSSSFDVKKIARNITRLMEDENLMKRIGDTAFEYVCQNHNLNLWKEKWREVIYEV